MPVLDSFLDAMGNTPLVRLRAVARGVKPTILAKLEMLNPGSSVKDRIGIRMIEAAEREGLLKPGGTIVEPTSGNTGHGLAIAAAVRGYRCIFVMPDKMSQEKISLLRAYGAEVVICPTAVAPESPESYYRVADRLAAEIPGAFQPNQYHNPVNPQTHYDTTGPEIWEQTEGRLTAFVCGVGTGGTISGAGRYLKEQNAGRPRGGRRPGGIALFRRHPAALPRRGDRRGLLPLDVRSVGGGSIRAGLRPRLVPDGARHHPPGRDPRRGLERHRGVRRAPGRPRAGRSRRRRSSCCSRTRDGSTCRSCTPTPGCCSTGCSSDPRWSASRRSCPRSPVRSPALVTVNAHDKVRQAVETLQEHGISQAPVVREESIEVSQFVGSIRDRELLERVFRDPDALQSDVAEAMGPPIPMVEWDEPVEMAFAELERTSALVVTKVGPGARRLDPERPPRVPRSPAPGVVSARARAGDRRRRRQGPRPRADRRAARTRSRVVPRVGLDRLAGLIDELAPDAIAIDSPPGWASDGGSRLTERTLAEFNIHSFNTPAAARGKGVRFYEWMEVGFRVFRAAAKAGFPRYAAGDPRGTAMEVFPHGSATVLTGCLRPKGIGKRAWREGVLRSQGVPTDELRSGDLIDAGLCALTGLLALQGKHFAPGDPREGAIVLPVVTLPAAPVSRRASRRSSSCGHAPVPLLRMRGSRVPGAHAGGVRARSRRQAQVHAVASRP